MRIVDCHFHVIAPADRHPMHAGRSYTPEAASLGDWRGLMAPLGITHGVVVQPSVYGTDNRVLLDALQADPRRLAGVAAVSADIDDAELDRLLAAGVRGVRMAYFEPGDPRAMGGFVPFSAFDDLRDRLASRGLHLQLFTDSRLLSAIEARLMRSPVPVVIDHMGRAPAPLGARHDGIQSLCRLMRDGPVWVKLSGIANLSSQGPAYADARVVHDALVAAAPDRLVWGSDWPHTSPTATRPSTAALVHLMKTWLPAALQARIAWQNPAMLYGF